MHTLLKVTKHTQTRGKVDGWIYLGNEIDEFDINEAIEKLKNVD